MSEFQPYQVIQELRSNNSRLAKEAAVERAWLNNCTEFFRGAELTFNGLISFGVKQIPEKLDDNPSSIKFQDFADLATKLANRSLSGHAARDAILEFMILCSKDEWNLFYRLILLKDLKSGLSESTINKVLKKIGGDALAYVIKEYPYQRCSLPEAVKLDSFEWNKGVFSQTKSDGMYANVNVYVDGTVDILARSGKAFPLDSFGNLVDAVQQTFAPNTQSHGELLVFRNGRELPRKIGNGILNSVSQGGEFLATDHPVFVIWDQIPLDKAVSKGVCFTPYHERFAFVSSEVRSKHAAQEHIKLAETKIVYSLADAITHYKELLARGFEGTILKDHSVFWKDGTSKGQVKYKVTFEVDLEIYGFNAGTGKNAATFGSMQLRTSDGLLEVDISGFTDAERVEFNTKRESLIGSIVTMMGNDLMIPTNEGEKYSIFLPRFVELRSDKSQADSLAQVKAQFASAMK